MASYRAVRQATFARMDREEAQARAYQRKHGLTRRGQELRLEYLRGLYAFYLPRLDNPNPLTRNWTAHEMIKIMREADKIKRQLGQRN